MPAPTQVPPFLAAVLGSQTFNDDAKTSAGGSSSALLSSTSPAAYSHVAVDDQHRGDGNDGGIRAPVAAVTSTLVPSSSAAAAAKSHVFDAFAEDDWLASSTLPTLLVPPLNFDMVCASRSSHGGTLYRSGFPNERNYPFLNTLHLRTVVYLSSDDVRPNLQRWIDGSRGRTSLLHFRLNVNKEPFAEMDEGVVSDALAAILDKRNMPMLIHCNKGKYRVGVVTALIRRLQGWSMTSIYDEYARFAGADRIADEEFIDMFPVSHVRRDLCHAPDWLPR